MLNTFSLYPGKMIIHCVCKRNSKKNICTIVKNVKLIYFIQTVLCVMVLCKCHNDISQLSDKLHKRKKKFLQLTGYFFITSSFLLLLAGNRCSRLLKLTSWLFAPYFVYVHSEPFHLRTREHRTIVFSSLEIHWLQVETNALHASMSSWNLKLFPPG